MEKFRIRYGSGSLIRFMSCIITLLLIGTVFGSCTKSNNQNATSTVTTTGITAKSAVAVSTSKTTATAATGTAKSSSTGGAAGTAAASAGAQATAGTVAEADITDGNGADTQEPDRPVNEEAAFDLGGRQVKMISWQVADLNGDSPTSGSYAMAVYSNNKVAELKYNYSMVFDKSYCMAAVKYHEKIMSEIMAGINPADIFTINNANVEVLSFIKNNMVVCLNDYIDFEGDLYMKNHTWQSTTEYKGKIYGLTPNLYTGNNGIIYNTAILAQEGLSDIWDLYEDGRWNWQTLLEYSIKATKDTTGDGIIDQWGSTVYNNSTFVTYLLNSNGLPAVGQVDGKMICNYDTSAGKRALQFAVDLTFIHKVVGTGGGTAFRKGTVLFLWGPFWYNESCIKDNLTTSLVGPLPAGPDRPVTVSIKAPGTNFYVSALSNIPREAATILRDILITWTEDGQKRNAALAAAEDTAIKPWVEGSAKRYYWTERDAVNSSQCVFPVIAEFSTMTGAEKVAANIINDIMKGVSVSTAVETYIGQINGVLEEINR